MKYNPQKSIMTRTIFSGITFTFSTQTTNYINELCGAWNN